MQFSLERYITARRRQIEKALTCRLPSESMPPRDLHRAMRYAVLGGGKRLRPLLCLAFAEAAGGKCEMAMKPALSVELLHCYTLVHDDLPCMDNDDWRRGKPTCHRKFGEAMAVLVGDALQALAFEVAAEASVPAPYSATELVRELALAAGSRGLVAGQVEDTVSRGKPSVARIRYVGSHKTAALFVASCRMGVISAGGQATLLTAAEGYGLHFGMAFQIVDDLSDACAGHSLPTDDGMNCLQVWTREAARDQALKHLTQARKALVCFPHSPARLALAGLTRWLAHRMT